MYLAKLSLNLYRIEAFGNIWRVVMKLVNVTGYCNERCEEKLLFIAVHADPVSFSANDRGSLLEQRYRRRYRVDTE